TRQFQPHQPRQGDHPGPLAAADPRGSRTTARSDTVIMDLSTVHQGVHKRRKKKRVGRGPGSGHGKTATRGSQGQYSSAGAHRPFAVFEGGQMQLFRRIPKRGFSNARFQKDYLIVNVGDLDAAFKDGDVVDREALRRTGLAKGPADGIRILGNGELTKKLVVK